MTKKERLKGLCELIKGTYNLDVVTAVSTKSQYKKLGREYNPKIVLFKMRYRLTGGDTVQLCPISWLVIDQVDFVGDDPDDLESHDIYQDEMLQLIIQTCGEVLASHPDVKRVLSNMAQNAVARAEKWPLNRT